MRLSRRRTLSWTCRAWIKKRRLTCETAVLLSLLSSANKGLPPALGRGVCETKSKNGRPRPRKPFISRVFCAQRGSETMVSDHARPWGRGRSGDCDQWHGRFATRFARINSRESLASETPIFFCASGRFAGITRISDSRESPDSRGSCDLGNEVVVPDFFFATRWGHGRLKNWGEFSYLGDALDSRPQWPPFTFLRSRADG